MTFTFTEHQGCFEIALTAETQKEALQLVRFGLNKTKEVRHLSTYVGGEEAMASVIIGKKRQPENSIT